MSDPFHAGVPLEFIRSVFAFIGADLTRRTCRALALRQTTREQCHRAARSAPLDFLVNTLRTSAR